MRIGSKFLSAAAGLVLAGAAIMSPAAAAPLGHPLSLSNAVVDGHVENVRWRGGGGHWGGGGPWRGGYGYRGYRGWGAAPFVGGLAAGAIVGGALAYPRYYSGPYPDTYVDNYDYDTYAGDDVPGANAAAYCAQRFRSYDPRSGTYLGNNGIRHPCP